jgi:hypothetical protein
MYKFFNIVLFREAWDETLFVLINTSYQVICDADIQSAVALTRHDVNVVWHEQKSLDPRLRWDDKFESCSTASLSAQSNKINAGNAAHR